MLAAAMNPCPCGFWGSVSKECLCTPLQIQRYLSKISGPLLDRIDLHIDVPEVSYHDLVQDLKGESSKTIARRVKRVRKTQIHRYRTANIYCNAQMDAAQLREHCALNGDAQALLENAIEKLGFSARAYHRVLKVARTIADLNGSRDLGSEHVAEAIQYRSLDRNFWHNS